MFEVELKAHVDNRKALIDKINTFAKYSGYVKRDDYYWGKGTVKIRIRKQTNLDNSENTSHDKADNCILLTYKRKELRPDSNGNSIEVNDEKETVIDDAVPLESFLQDAGFTITLNKVKEVMDWEYDGATLELCNVKGLGDFLEIEIMSPSDDKKCIAKLRNKLLTILDKTCIDRSRIEDRYYSEMLDELKSRA